MRLRLEEDASRGGGRSLPGGAHACQGAAIITASRPTEVSIGLPERGHVLFTYYVGQGLKGAADLNRDGIVSLQELY